jgi:uncharacterized protein involved in exopolysaccharide biosynthesis
MAAGPPDTMDVGGFGVMRRRLRWAMLALAAVVGLLLVVDVPVLGAKTYVATAEVLVSPTGVNGSSVAAGEINLDAEAQLLKSVDVATRAKALLKVPDEPRDLAANVSVTIPPNVSVLNISYRAATRGDAQRRVTAFAEAYLDNRVAVATAKLRTQAAALHTEIAAATKRLREMTAQKAALPKASPERAHVDAQEDILIKEITRLKAELRPIEVALAAKIIPGRVISSPKLPEGD